MEHEIIPSERIPTKNLKQDDKLPSYLPHGRGLVLIQGSAGSGKSSFLYSMIKDYQRTNYFDVIIVYNQVSDSDHVWRGFGTKKTEVEVFNRYDDAELYDIIANIDEAQANIRELRPSDQKLLNIAFIFDDMIYSGICAPHKKSALDQLVINRRHLNCQVFITSQSYHALNQNIRTNNVSMVVVMRANVRDLVNIGMEHNAGVCSIDDFIEMYNHCKDIGNYEYLVVDYSKPQNRIFSRGFEITLNPGSSRRINRVQVEEL